jgi:hypothetical protein
MKNLKILRACENNKREVSKWYSSKFLRRNAWGGRNDRQRIAPI